MQNYYCRPNPITGKPDYFFPMELTDDAMRDLAETQGLNIGQAKLGGRTFTAVWVPCKDTAMINGREVFIDTPSDVQRERYLQYIKDELKEQESIRLESRCLIPGIRGGLKRCPRFIPRPGSDSEMSPVRCEGCKYELYHDRELSQEELEDVPSPDGYLQGDRYATLTSSFLSSVRKISPQLVALAELLTQEYTLIEAGEELGIPQSTASSQRKDLIRLCRSFLNHTISIG